MFCTAPSHHPACQSYLYSTTSFFSTTTSYPIHSALPELFFSLLGLLSVFFSLKKRIFFLPTLFCPSRFLKLNVRQLEKWLTFHPLLSILMIPSPSMAFSPYIISLQLSLPSLQFTRSNLPKFSVSSLNSLVLHLFLGLSDRYSTSLLLSLVTSLF